MTKLFLPLIILLTISSIFAEDQMLPKHMIFTQRMLWGKKGLMRVTKIVPLTNENRLKELEVRNKLILTHRIIGYTTAAQFLANTIIGLNLYNGNNKLKDIHSALVISSNITYFTGLSIALFTPPNSVTNKHWSSVVHKILAPVHLVGMIATDILGDKAEKSKKYKKLHRTAAIATFAAFELAAITVHF